MNITEEKGNVTVTFALVDNYEVIMECAVAAEEKVTLVVES